MELQKVKKQTMREKEDSLREFLRAQNTIIAYLCELNGDDIDTTFAKAQEYFQKKFNEKQEQK